MSDPATTIQAAADTVSATHALLTSIIEILPTVGYAITIAAAFIPKPDDSAPPIAKFVYKVVTYIAFNIKHARNIPDDRRKEERDEPEQTPFDEEPAAGTEKANVD